MRKLYLGLLVLGVLAVFSLGPLAQTTQKLDSVILPGLKVPVQVIQDKYGIPHVFAQNALDLYRVVGWIQARDRLFSMDVLRRTANGTLAELLGLRMLSQDVQLRTLGVRRAAELAEKVLTQEIRAELEAYATGVNAYIDRINTSGQLPPEYKELELTKVAPWTITDSLALGKLLTFDLSFVIDAPNVLTYFEYRKVGSAQGFNGHALYFDDLFRSAPAERAAIVPDSEGRLDLQSPSESSIRPPDISPTTLSLLKDFYSRIKDIELFKSILERAEMETGSNWLLIAGKNSASGYPLLFNDPHLGLPSPGVWYAMDHKSADGINAVGTCFAGIPYVILGHTAKIAWSAAVNPLDTTDMYQEQVVEREGKLVSNYQGKLEPLTVIPQSYKVNQIGDGQMDNLVPAPNDKVSDQTYIISRHGPVVSLDLKKGEAITIQWTGFYATYDIFAFRLWNHAGNLEQFKEGVKFFDAGSQNWGYADIEGNIAYFTGAESPLREDLQRGAVAMELPPFFVRDGTGSAGHEWIQLQGEQREPSHAIPFEILPFSETPQTVNPANGFIVSANNDPVGTTLDNDPLNQKRPGSNAIYYLDWNYDIGFRAARITELVTAKIAKGEKFTLEDMHRIQSDTASLIGRRLMPRILTAFKNAGSDEAPDELRALAKDVRLGEAVEQYLSKWSFATPTGLPEGFDADDAVGRLNAPAPAEITDSVATTVFNMWLSVMVKRVIDDTLDHLTKDMTKPGSFLSITALLNLLDNFEKKRGKGVSGVDFFDNPDLFLDEESERDWAILQSLRDALDLLASEAFAQAYNKSTNLADYRWGKLHRITFKSDMHPQTSKFSIPPAVYTQPEYALGLPVDGTLATVDVANYSLRGSSDAGFTFSRGVSQRHVVELNPNGIRAFNALPGGNSGVVNTTHFGDLLSYWLLNDSYPVLFTETEIKANAESEQEFKGN